MTDNARLSLLYTIASEQTTVDIGAASARDLAARLSTLRKSDPFLSNISIHIVSPELVRVVGHPYKKELRGRARKHANPPDPTARGV